MTNNEELILINDAKMGNQQSFSILYDEYKILVKKVVRKFFLIGAEMEDLQQVGTIGLFNAVNTFDLNKDASFKTYATVCIKRAVLSFIKQLNNKNNKLFNQSLAIDGNGAMIVDGSIDEDDDMIIVLPSHAMLPDDKLIWKEKLQEIRDFVAKNLSTYEKLVLSEYLKGKSYSEISKVVNKDTTSVENALSRIRVKLSPLKNI